MGLVALSAVLTATMMVACGNLTTPLVMVSCCVWAMTICAGVGAFSGVMITLFRIPPFIATLAMMEVARGLALMITKSQSIAGLPPAFDWLGLDVVTLRFGRAFELEIPNAVILMVFIYAAAQFVMGRTRLGRYVYAVGGNREAARLSGIRVNRVLLTVYVVSAAMAGLGGVIEASQFTSGDPKSGLMYELQVIAAVVVGGTSLAGGEGKVLGTLIGALIIAVIQNGMNLTEVGVYTQRVVLGLVILGAVLLDMLRKKGWRGLLTAE
ncbi:MAG: ABC transporter permease [Pirellulales bacterium]|nr:ABC transporter permease [Pirellulales bacterium]